MPSPIDLPLSIERYRNSFRLVDREAFVIAYMEDADNAVNDPQSAFIVRAVNNHDALVTALESALGSLTYLEPEAFDNAAHKAAWNLNQQRLRDTLAKATAP